MSCDRIADKLADYITGRLELEERERVTAHLDGCHACRLFRDQAVALYSIDYDVDQAVPPTRVSAASLLCDVVRERKPTSHWYATARVVTALAAVIVLCFSWVPKTGPTPVAPEVVNATLQPISLEVPQLPAEYPENGWLDDPEQAARLAAYTGKPLLTAYSWTVCPRCKAMATRFTSARGVALVRDFIAVRVVFSGELPEALRGYPMRMRWQFMMPAIVITDTDKPGPARFAVGSLDDVSRYIGTWRKTRKQPLLALDRSQFEACRKVLSAIPAQLQTFAYAELLASLDSVIELRDRYRTRFISDATALKQTLTRELDAQVTAIEQGISRGGDQATKELAVGRRLRAKLGDTELGRRLAAVIDD